MSGPVPLVAAIGSAPSGRAPAEGGPAMTTADASPVPDFGGLLRFDDRRFLVLGAGQGIGRQVVHGLAQLGARVWCVDVDPDRAAEVAAELGPGHESWAGDITRRDEIARLFTDVRAGFGGLEGLVDIVGMAQYADLADTSDELWDWHFDIVLRHAWMAMQEGGRLLSEGGGGAMAFVASVSGLTSAPRHSAYGAAKAGLMSLVRTGAVELGPSNVRVNAVAPGVVWTPRVSAFLGDEGRVRNEENAPLHRVALPMNIAAALLFLCSDLAATVTGQTLVVDAGVSAKFPYPMTGN
jgi:NAD(P)-dependent dehydrogenase (short-subunit alcohol dehydrogenase family)